MSLSKTLLESLKTVKFNYPHILADENNIFILQISNSAENENVESINNIPHTVKTFPLTAPILLKIISKFLPDSAQFQQLALIYTQRIDTNIRNAAQTLQIDRIQLQTILNSTQSIDDKKVNSKYDKNFKNFKNHMLKQISTPNDGFNANKPISSLVLLHRLDHFGLVKTINSEDYFYKV